VKQPDKWNCDRCGRETTQPHLKRQLTRQGSSQVFDRNEGPEYHLCDSCDRTFRDGFMKNESISPANAEVTP
jgi:hypothetical protein